MYNLCIQKIRARARALFPASVLLGLSLSPGLCATFESFEYTVGANDKVTITKFACDVAEAVIPELIGGKSVTTIGGDSFAYCESLTKLTVPASVTAIENFAFQSCSALERITFLGEPPVLGGSNVFYQTKGTLAIYYIVGTPNWGASYGGKATVPYDPDSSFITSVENGEVTITRFSCDVADAVIPASIGDLPVTTIGNYAFTYCYDVLSVTIPDSVVTVGNYAFSNCLNLASVEIGNGVTSIGDYAFEYGLGLTSLTFPDGVATIGEYAFVYCSNLTTVTIPASVTSIGQDAFQYCSSLTAIYFLGDPPALGSPSVFNNTNPNLVIYYVDGSTSWDSLTTFGGVQTQSFVASSKWGVFDLIDSPQGLYVDTAGWLGFLEVSASPWIWSVSLSKWLYIPDSSADTGQGWIYAVK